MNKLNKLDKIIFSLFLLFVFFLPYIKVGFLIGRFTFSIPDLALFLSFLFICSKIVINNFKFSLDKQIKRFLLIQILFIFLLALSGFKMLESKPYIFAFFPLIYALILTFTFGYIYHYHKDRLLVGIQRALLLAILISFVPVVLHILGLHIDLFFSGTVKYTFLCRNPNQYGIFLSVGLSIYVMLHVLRGDRYKNNILLFSTLLIALISSLFVASRVTLVYVFIIFVAFFLHYLISIFYISHLTLKRLVNRSIYLILIIGIMSVGLMITSNLFTELQKKFWTARRTLEVIDYIKEKRLNPRREATIKIGIETFKQNYLLGVGLGNFRKFYNPYSKHEIHNTFISLLAETGIIGFSGYIILMCFILIRLTSIKIPPMTKMLFISFFIGYLLVNLPHYMLRERWVWLYFLVIVASSGLYKKPELGENRI